MGKPVNDITGDAPDGQNPEKKYVPPKEGKWKFAPSPPPKPNPKDAGVFTEEMLQRSGGKMKEPPYDPEGKKRGGSIKRRYARGGEIMDVEPVNETEASDKAAGLKASNGEDVGFFKRLSMGNIDQPGSEAYEKFGAGRGRAKEAAAESARESGRTVERYKPAAVETEKPVAPVASVAIKPDKYSDYGDNADAGHSYSTIANKPSVNKPSASKPSVSSRPSVDADIRPSSTSSRDAEQGMSRGARNTNIDMAEGPTYNGPRTGPEKKTVASNKGNAFEVPPAPKVKAEIPTAGASKAPASTGEDTSGPSNIERILMATGVVAGAVRLGAAGAMGVKAYKAAQRAKELAKELDAAKRFSQPVAREAVKDLSKYTGKQELEAAESTLRGANSRKGIRQRNPDSKVEYKRGGNVKAYASGGSVSASSRGDGCAQRGKTRGTMR